MFSKQNVAVSSGTAAQDFFDVKLLRGDGVSISLYASKLKQEGKDLVKQVLFMAGVGGKKHNLALKEF